MKLLLTAAAALVATGASAQASCSEEGGNYYCAPIDAITYTDVGGSGSYGRVVSMDSTSGVCQSVPQQYSGNIAPFNEEVSQRGFPTIVHCAATCLALGVPWQNPC